MEEVKQETVQEKDVKKVEEVRIIVEGDNIRITTDFNPYSTIDLLLYAISRINLRNAEELVENLADKSIESETE